jgi:hypothetical protein
MLLRRVAFPDFCEPCLPSPADKPPAGAGWLHEIKHDGFRMLVRRNAGGVRLLTETTGPAASHWSRALLSRFEALRGTSTSRNARGARKRVTRKPSVIHAQAFAAL